MLGLVLKTLPADAVLDTIDDDTALVTLTHVDYRSAAIHDMGAINEAARAMGALTVWDLSHSAGAIELELVIERGEGGSLLRCCHVSVRLT